MSKSINLGPYIAQRLVYFKKGYEKIRAISDDIPDAYKEGKVVISGLEFRIQSVDRNFIAVISPVKKEEEWGKFERHIERIKEDKFWESDDSRRTLKKAITEFRSGGLVETIEEFNKVGKDINYFVDKREEKIKDNKLRISGVFLNYNESHSYKYILYTIVRPLILYKNFL